MSILSWLFTPKQIRADDPGQSDFRLIGSQGPGAKAAGTSHYQKQLRKLAGPKGRFGKQDRIRVLLIPEPDNQFDENAVRIAFQDETLGYLSQGDARNYIESLEKLGRNGGIGNASADIVGGWRDEQSEGSFGLRLLYDRPIRISGQKQ